MVHRRVALLGGSFVSVADEPTAVDRVAIVGDGLMAGAGLAGADPAAAAPTPSPLSWRPSSAWRAADRRQRRVRRRGGRQRRLRPPGPSLDDEYVTGPQAPLATTTQARGRRHVRRRWRPRTSCSPASAPRTSASTPSSAQCGHGCDTRWRFTAQQVLRDRVYPRVYENLRALRAAHPDAVVVAFAPPTPVAAGSACAAFGTGGGHHGGREPLPRRRAVPVAAHHDAARRDQRRRQRRRRDPGPRRPRGVRPPHPWVNGLRPRRRRCDGAGSFLPNAAGHAAIADYLRGVVVGRRPAPAENPQVAGPARPGAAGGGTVRGAGDGRAGSTPATAGTCPLRVTVGGLRNGDRVDLLVDGLAPVPSEAAAGPDGTVDVTVQVPEPTAPTPVVVEVSSIDRNLRGSTVATIGVPSTGLRSPRPTSATVDEDGVAVVDVLANDDGSRSVTSSRSGPGLVTGPAHGTAVVEDDVVLGRRVVRYQPAAGYCGPDSFTYEIADAGDLRATATVSVTVRCVNDPPDAGRLRRR